MNILYCSTVCSIGTLNRLSLVVGKAMTSETVQKFHRLILRGLVANLANVETITVPPIAGKLNNNRWINIESDREDGISYQYLKTWNLPVLRHLCIVIGTILTLLKWHKRNKFNEHIVVCDALNISICLGALIGKWFNVKVVGLMTDMPGLMVSKHVKQTTLGSIITKINILILKQFNAYIFLTEAMNDIINVNKCPYIIMEGVVDINMQKQTRTPNTKVRNLIYAGGCHERYGVKMLIDAFRNLPNQNISLSIYGDGPMVVNMPKYEALDPRFHYKGIRPNEEVVQAELQATLLINPRPTHEEFTKYSFPSKNMEYMVSGTPVLTMALPGMPLEYYNKLFVCKDETVSGLAQSLSDILKCSDEELSIIGQKAKEYVLQEKNNIKQAGRILNLLKNVV